MKPRPGKLIVEYKTRRRRPLKQEPTSIWGDVDLKAVADQVAADAPLTTEPATLSTPAPGQKPRPASANPAQQTKHLAAKDQLPPKPGPTPPASQPRLKCSASAEKPQDTGKTPHGTTRQTPLQSGDLHRSAPTTPESASNAGSNRALTLQSDATEPPRPEMLARLEAENQHLKSLLAQQLLTQNQQLKKLLDLLARSQ